MSNGDAYEEPEEMSAEMRQQIIINFKAEQKRQFMNKTINEVLLSFQNLRQYATKQVCF